MRGSRGSYSGKPWLRLHQPEHCGITTQAKSFFLICQNGDVVLWLHAGYRSPIARKIGLFFCRWIKTLNSQFAASGMSLSLSVSLSSETSPLSPSPPTFGRFGWQVSRLSIWAVWWVESSRLVVVPLWKDEATFSRGFLGFMGRGNEGVLIPQSWFVLTSIKTLNPQPPRPRHSPLRSRSTFVFPEISQRKRLTPEVPFAASGSVQIKNILLIFLFFKTKNFGNDS